MFANEFKAILCTSSRKPTKQIKSKTKIIIPLIAKGILIVFL